MDYGAQKARQMARSLLPSTWGGARRHKARIHRAGRRRAKEEVALLVRDAEASEELDLDAVEDEAVREVREVVRDRRWADKVNPFIRWATAVTRHLPRESRLSHVRGCVPRGLIGEHAVGHLKREPAFEDPREREWRRGHWGGRRQRQWLDRGEYAELLRGVLRAGGHAEFNRWMRERHMAHDELRTRRQRVPSGGRDCTYEEVVRVRQGPIQVRLLRGMHDVLPFLDEVGQPSASRPEWFKAMDQFLRAFKQRQGNVQATLETLGVRW